MHDELNRVKYKPQYKQINCDSEPLDMQSQIWYDYFRNRDDSIISDIFEGQLCGRTKCVMCGYESFTFDHFMDVSLPLPSYKGSVTL